MGKEPEKKSDDFEEEAKKPAEKPVSLHPLKFEEALSGLLKTSSANGEVQSGKRGRSK